MVGLPLRLYLDGLGAGCVNDPAARIRTAIRRSLRTTGLRRCSWAASGGSARSSAGSSLSNDA
jgi:hypothetical protein